jgi:hypothetical protein
MLDELRAAGLAEDAQGRWKLTPLILEAGRAHGWVDARETVTAHCW